MTKGLEVMFPLHHRLSLRFLCSIVLLCFIFYEPVFAQQTEPKPAPESEAETRPIIRNVIQGSGLPVPRFVSLKSSKVNMRVGPGREYPLEWVYIRKGLPLKVIAEFDVWRKVIDHEGGTGWVHSQLVSLKRQAIVTDAFIKLRRKPDLSTQAIAIAEKDVVMEIQFCEEKWCKLASEDVKGWAPRDSFWGIMEGETLN